MTIHRLLLLLILLPSLGFNHALMAQNASTDDSQQEAPKETLYIVEMIFFTHNNKSAKTEEQWPTNIELTLPQPQSYLVQDSLEAIFPDALTAKQLADNTTQLGLSDSLAEDKIIEESENLAELISTPASALPLLDDSYFELNDAARSFKGLARYRFLKHIAFAQRITNKHDAPHIIIKHENRDEGKQPLNLMGSIQLYKGRFLHLKTNLWLNLLHTAESEHDNPAAISAEAIDAQLLEAENLDELLAQHSETQSQAQENINTPIWPTPPSIANISTLKELALFNQQQEQQAISDKLAQEKAAAQTALEQPAVEGIDSSALNNIAETETQPLTAQTTSDENIINTEAPAALEPSSQLVTELIATLKQKRKMRSYTRHYIDHPLMGILIEIRPFPVSEEKPVPEVDINNSKVEGHVL